jgi:hypothetical protein
VGSGDPPPWVVCRPGAADALEARKRLRMRGGEGSGVAALAEKRGVLLIARCSDGYGMAPILDGGARRPSRWERGCAHAKRVDKAG